jgi:uncharacterized protein YoxC
MFEKISLNKILQYVAQIIAIYLIFKYVPTQQIDDNDIIIITIIITIFCILLENIVSSTKSEQDKLCSTVCANKKPVEHMSLFDTFTQQSTVVSPVQPVIQEVKPVIQEVKPVIQEVKPVIQEVKPVIQEVKEVESNNVENENMSSEDDYYDSLYPTKYYSMTKSENIERVGSRMDNDLIRSDMPYNDYNHLPVSKEYTSSVSDYGYSFLPPEKWYPEPPFPPVCVTEKRCPVIPTYTSGTDISLKEWDNSRRVTPPDNINTKFVKEVLNSGR